MESSKFKIGDEITCTCYSCFSKLSNGGKIKELFTYAGEELHYILEDGSYIQHIHAKLIKAKQITDWRKRMGK